MIVTVQQLCNVFPVGCRARVVAQFAQHLNNAMVEYGINTPARQAAFLAQIGHESGELQYVRELASGEEYEGRRDLGNTQAGDGVRYKGRGLIQLTGRANYARLKAAWGVDLIARPELLETPVFAARSAAWFWADRNLNALADAGNFQQITRRINGGTNGLAARVRYWEAWKAELGVDDTETPDKSLMSSKTAWATGGTAVATSGTAVSQLGSWSDQLQNAASTGYSVAGAWGAVKAVVGSAALPWLLLLVVAGVCAYLWWRYRSKVKAGHTTVI